MTSPFVVVGLGNPGSRYAETRHNAGYLVLDALAETLGAAFGEESRFLGSVARVSGETGKIILVKPTTFMNLSGASVKKILDFYNVPLDRLLVVCDEADLPFGHIRLREKGSCGGHNGLRSIEESLQAASYPRLRLGIGKSFIIPLDAYVLMRFKDEEWASFSEICTRAIEIIKIWALEGMAKAQEKAASLKSGPQ